VSDLLGTNWPSYTFWSLCTLFQAYFLWLVLYGLIGYGLTADDPNQRHRQTTRLLSSIAFALFVVGGWMLQSGRGIGWMLPTNMAYIASGWLVYQMVIGEFGRWIIPWVISVFFAAAFTSNSVRPIYAALTLLALAVAVRMEHFQVWKPFQWLTLVSTWSYSIYLTHGLVGHKIFWFAEELGISMSSGVAVAIAVVTVIASIALGSIFHRLVEVPFTRLSRYNRIDFPSLHPAAGRLAGTNHR
jgi:peptidoglycan/LPS O-acetylase OafA/YrhL